MHMAETEWFYARGGVQTGPVTASVLRQLIAVGQIGRADPVWCEGMTEWRPAGELPELFPPVVAPPVQPHYASPAYARPAPVVGKSYNGFAVAGFVLAIIPALTLLGLIFSLIALNGMKRSGNPEGKGLATAGMVISIIFLSLGCLYVAAVFTCMGAAFR